MPEPEDLLRYACFLAKQHKLSKDDVELYTHGKFLRYKTSRHQGYGVMVDRASVDMVIRQISKDKCRYREMNLEAA